MWPEFFFIFLKKITIIFFFIFQLFSDLLHVQASYVAAHGLYNTVHVTLAVE